MAGTDPPIIYCDTAVLLDWIGRTSARPNSAAAAGLLNAILAGNARGVTSSIAKLEILECKNDETAWRVWQSLQANRNFHVAMPTIRVMDIAYEIRNYYQNLHEEGADGKKGPLIPDAIHIATAIYTNCSKMFTYDGIRRSRGVNSEKCKSPIELSGLIAGKWQLEICPPNGFDPGLAV